MKAMIKKFFILKKYILLKQKERVEKKKWEEFLFKK